MTTTRYAESAEIQKAVNLAATGLSNMEVSIRIGRPYGTVNAWLRPGGLAQRRGIVAGTETIVETIPPEKIRVRVKAGSTPEASAIKVLAIGDAHDSPHLAKQRFRWMGKLAADRGVDWAVSIGDLFTFDSLNAHIPNDTILGKQKSPWVADMQSAKEALGEFDIGLGLHRCNKHETEGNHERRIYFYEEARPEIAGVLVNEFHQALADHGWKSTPYGEYFFLGGVGFIHCAINRLNKSYGGKTAENTIANDAVFDHVIGHSHVKREHRAPKLGPSQHVTVLNLGCALPQGHVESYMYHGALTGWWWGCHVLTIQGGQIVGVDAVPMSELERMYA